MVTPRTESDLVAEVRGRVLWISEDLVVGGFFMRGDELLRLDDREHRIARDRARATVTLRKSEARLALAEAARRRQLKSRGAASAADLEQFESRERVADASLAEARAAFAQVELDLERTIVRAPFDGRVRERIVDVGQFVSPGIKLGRIFAIDYAEVRLPVRTDELAYLDPKFVGLDRRDELEGTVPGAPVRLSGRLGGRELFWDARLVRAEAAIDEQTRMLHVVARIDDPYLRNIPADDDGGTASKMVPLPVGLFVTAEIEGRSVTDVFVVPVMALRDGDQVFVLDEEDRLRVRAVSVVRRDRGQVVIDGGLEAGDELVISPLRIYSEGMTLRTVAAESS
jgi:RND family efflux transporter MFP subunit